MKVSEAPAEDVEQGPDWDDVVEMVGVCEAHADRLFDGEERFTAVTTWQDGDFRIEVRHGKGHEDSPYSQSLESVTYRHFDGKVAYADMTRYIDHHLTEHHETMILEERQAPRQEDQP